MPEMAEISKGIYAQLEEVADIMDMPVSSLLDDILRRWVEEDYESIVEGESDEEPGDYQDDGSEDRES